jgi:hypothetical protein
LVFHSPNGTVHRFWRPASSGERFTLRRGSILEPLRGLEEHLVIVDGLDFLTGTNHGGGIAAMLTNRGGLGTETGGMSLDQYVASHIGGEDRFSSLELGVLTDYWGANAQTRISYSAPGRFVHPDADPVRVFRRMFGDVYGDAETAEKLQRRRQSVLDLARDDLRELRGALGAEERLKLDAHLHSLRSVERGLSIDLGGRRIMKKKELLDKNNNQNFPAILRYQMELAILALACGMTKVVTLQLSHTVSPLVFTWAGNTHGHHALSHASDDQEDELGQFVAAERWIAGEFGRLVQRLLEVEDPATGAPLLDDTLVVWAKEIGDSRTHLCEDVPFVLAGSAGGAWATGRYLQAGGQSHAHLLVSVCQAMGLSNETFGEMDSGRGPLVGLS